MPNVSEKLHPHGQALKPEDAASYFDGVIERFGGWVQYGDTKAGAVLVVLGLGLSDLVGAAPELINTHGWGTFATVAFAGALAAAALAVFFLGRGVFPFAPHHRDADDSLFYYRDVAWRKDANEYEHEVIGMKLDDLNRHRAVEAYGLAKIAEEKAKRTGWALVFAGLFVFLWPAARVALALVK